MTQEQIQSEVETALGSLEPVEVRIHKEYEDVLTILVLSNKFNEEPYAKSLFKRMEKCIDLLMDNSELDENFLFQIEPVTPAEFKTRLVPWPE